MSLSSLFGFQPSYDELRELIKKGNYDRIHKALKKKNTYSQKELDNFFILAIHRGKLHIAGLLIQYGANINTDQTCEGYPPLGYSVVTGDMMLARLLIENGVNIDETFYDKDHCSSNALFEAVEKGNFEIIKFLVDHGANLFVQGCEVFKKYGAFRKNKPIRDFLLEKVDMSDLKQCQKVAYHVLENNDTLDDLELLKVFVDKGVELDSYGLNKLLHKFIRNNNGLEFIMQVIEMGADINDRQLGDGYTPLMEAIRVKDEYLVEYFISEGANINVTGSYGETPLMIAVDQYNLKVVKLLVKNGADLNIRGEQGRYRQNTALDLTKSNADSMSDVLNEKARKIVEYLKQESRMKAI